MTNRVSNHVTDDITWPQRWCEAVRSAILATAWLLVFPHRRVSPSDRSPNIRTVKPYFHTPAPALPRRCGRIRCRCVSMRSDAVDAVISHTRVCSVADTLKDYSHVTSWKFGDGDCWTCAKSTIREISIKNHTNWVYTTKKQDVERGRLIVTDRKKVQVLARIYHITQITSYNQASC